jgi:4Fe-4S ferredoxin
VRLGKTEKAKRSDGKLVLRRRMIGLDQELVLDRETCCGCRDCQVICPTDSISSTKAVVKDGRAKALVSMDIDPETCIFCGLCAVICPTTSILWRENEATVPTVLTAEILPPLDENIAIEAKHCRIDCGLACRTACPVEAITVRTEPEAENGGEKIVDVTVDLIRCFYCGRCQPACPYGLIGVKKARQGMIVFSPEHCPPGCRACADVCPSGAFEVQEGVVTLDERFCLYCRACANVCPEAAALEVKRDFIRGRPLRSQLWIEMHGKLVSPATKVRLVQEQAAEKRARAFRTRID